MIDFNQPYSRPYFTSFLENFLPEDFKEQDENIEIPFQSKYFESVTFLGEADSLSLTIYEVQHSSENDARIGLTREMFRLMAAFGKRKALVVLAPKTGNNYRFSLVTIDLNIDEKNRIKKDFSNPKRYSFILGENAKIHTPQRFLIAQGRVSDFIDLQKRFSVEVVNKEFYNQIAVMFSRLVGGKRKQGSRTKQYDHVLLLPSTPYENNEQKYKEFAVRLIGRTVFCWFLKKKKSANGIPLIPEDVLSTFAISFNPNYYHGRVEPLFFNVLNTPVNDRGTEFKEQPYNKIPFLNGGLFEPQPDDYYTGNRPNYALKIPDQWWKDFINILETYNFTIDENTSIDIDLSVDPEMLGRIFENLLAEINPETGESARKSTGSYYTPRPIVEYMVDESLKQYLVTKTGIEEEKLETLLDYSREESGLLPGQETNIIDALNEIKVLDPACGSGAFPMGILQKMLLVLQKVDHGAVNSIEQILNDIKDPVYRKLIESKLKAAQVYDDEDLDDYARKLNIIRRSIYGVDIQPVAIDIAKLRFFLSIIVDEVIQDELPNRGIEPLPNLEFKFVCANTLIPLPPDRQLFDNIDLIEKLEELRDNYFISFGEDKISIKKEFNRVQAQMFNDSINLLNREPGLHNSSPQTQTQILATWNPFINETTTWFDPKWMFGETNGFDLVIGNPPHIQLQKLNKNGVQKKLSELGYKTFIRTGDIYMLFYERGVQLLRSNGNIILITNSTWLRTSFGQKLKNFVQNYSSLLKVIDLSDCDLFSNAAVLTTIIQVQKGNDGLKKSKGIRITKKNQEAIFDLNNYFKKNHISLSDFKTDEAWSILDRNRFGIKKKVNLLGKRLTEWELEINYGLKTGLNSAFIIDESKKQELIKEDKASKDILKPLLRGRDIKRYLDEYSGLWLLFIPWHFPLHNDKTIVGATSKAEPLLEENYPAIYKHLLRFKTDLLNRNQAEVSIRYEWFALQRFGSKYWKKFEDQKIIFPNMTKNMPFIYDEVGYFTNQKCFFITGEKLKYLVSIFNSKLYEYCYRSNFPELLGGVVELSKVFFEKVPIKYPTSGQEEIFTSVCDRLHQNLKETKEVSITISNQIDLMVYKLYELSYEEALIVDHELPGIISREDYEKAGVEVLAEWELK